MSQPFRTPARVDLSRYMGHWYVIANIPYFAEKNCFDSIESYALRADGDIDNWFSCRKGSFDAPMERRTTALATVRNRATNAEWRVHLFKVISVKYFILDIDPDYQWVAIGHPSRRYGWIMARSKTLPDSTYHKILQGLAEQGYDIGKFNLVPQQPVPATSAVAAPSGARSPT